jgi:hypothetical protein
MSLFLFEYIFPVLRSRSRKEPHRFGGTGAEPSSKAVPDPALTASALTLMFNIKKIFNYIAQNQKEYAFNQYFNVC